jgi:rhodanese-related sulfurtransferase
MESLLKSNNVIIAIAVVLLIAATLVIVAFQDQDDDDTTEADNAGVAQLVQPGVIEPGEYLQQFDDVEHILIDVREPGEYASGHIEGAINIPIGTILSGQRLNEIPQDVPVVVYCRSDNRSGQVWSYLNRQGYTQIYDINGGTVEWTRQGLDLE